MWRSNSHTKSVALVTAGARAVEPPPWLPLTPKQQKVQKRKKKNQFLCQVRCGAKAKPLARHRCGNRDSGHRASAGSSAHACMRLLRAMHAPIRAQARPHCPLVYLFVSFFFLSPSSFSYYACSTLMIPFGISDGDK